MVATSNVTLTGLIPATAYKLKVSYTCPGGAKYSKSKNFSTPARLGIEDIIAPEIIPNPGSGLFNILNLDNSTNIRIFDITGKLTGEFTNQTNATLDLTNYAEGMYFVQFVKENSLVSVQQLVIAR